MKNKDYKIFMNVLMESDIMIDNPFKSYVHMHEIGKKIFNQENILRQ